MVGCVCLLNPPASQSETKHGHPDDLKVNTDNCGKDHPAIDTTATFTLSDDETMIRDMKLSIEKALKKLFARGNPVWPQVEQ